MSEEYNQGERDYGGERDADVKFDDFVGQIVKDPNEPPDLLLLSGYLGASSEEGHVRLYLDEELSRYVEIPNEAIRYTQPLPAEQSPLGGSLVWIDRSAEVLHGKAGTERSKATFLEGQIAQDFGAGAAGAGAGGEQAAAAGGAAAAPQSQFAVCQQSQVQVCIPQTEVGPKCQSQFGPCILPTEFPGCRTLTGIFCTRFGPICRKTLFDPLCTRFGPRCRPFTVQFPDCPNTQFADCPSAQICITQDLACQVGGPGIDPTIVQTATEQALCSRATCGAPQCMGGFEQFGGGPQFAAQQFGGAGAAAPGGGAIPAPTIFCPSPFIQCPPSQFVRCPPSVLVRCPPSVFVRCPPSVFVRCPPSVVIQCPPSQFVRCPSQGLPCPSGIAPCESQFGVCPSFVDACPSRFGCFESQAGCFEEKFGGGVQPRFAAAPIQPTRVRFACRTQFACPTQVEEDCPTRFCTVSFRCPSEAFPCPETLLCPTVQGCPSIGAPCPSQFGPCQSAVDACPTRINCPSISDPCVTQDLACQTVGQCPSAVDACPTRFGCETQAECFPTQICVTDVCGVSQACEPQFGGGGVQAQFAAQPRIVPTPRETLFGCFPTRSFNCPSRFVVACPSAVDACPTRFGCPSQFAPCQSQLIRCPSMLDACPTRFNCPSVNVPCVTRDLACQTVGPCPSAVDACPTRFGCFETQAGCFESRQCGGGFGPRFGGGGGFGGGGAGGGF